MANRFRVLGGIVFGFLLASVFVWAEDPTPTGTSTDDSQHLRVRSLMIVDENNTPRIVLYVEPKYNTTQILLQGPNGKYPCLEIDQFPDTDGAIRLKDETGNPVAVFSSTLHSLILENAGIETN